MKKSFTSDQAALVRVFGPQFRNRKTLEQRLGVRIHVRDHTVSLESRSRVHLTHAETEIKALLAGGGVPDTEQFFSLPEAVESQPENSRYKLVTSGRRFNIYPKSEGQHRFIEAVRGNDMVFVTGPAGTGKTFLACALAAEALKTRSVEKLVLTRPAVEAGENLGFLPGSLKEKVDPYLFPLYDALYEIFPREVVERYFADKVIEVSPLAYMRGRTLNSAFIILDEAQNTTPAQMKMFLTRLGCGSRAVVAGDATQSDLPPGRESGLLQARAILGGIEGVAFVDLEKSDVARHSLVRRILQAYETHGGANVG